MSCVMDRNATQMSHMRQHMSDWNKFWLFLQGGATDSWPRVKNLKPWPRVKNLKPRTHIWGDYMSLQHAGLRYTSQHRMTLQRTTFDKITHDRCCTHSIALHSYITLPYSTFHHMTPHHATSDLHWHVDITFVWHPCICIYLHCITWHYITADCIKLHFNTFRYSIFHTCKLREKPERATSSADSTIHIVWFWKISSVWTYVCVHLKGQSEDPASMLGALERNYLQYIISYHIMSCLSVTSSIH